MRDAYAPRIANRICAPHEHGRTDGTDGLTDALVAEGNDLSVGNAYASEEPIQPVVEP